MCREVRGRGDRGDHRSGEGRPGKAASEAADVLYHLLVMLAARDVTLAEVLAELERREGTSGLAEKAGR
jgi:phosphoribosyl-ATP pyrophosphohydrolase